jgi:hypothetical protein
MNAAWLRKAAGDLKAFMEAFAVRMEGAIPAHVAVKRKRDGLFSSNTHVEQVAISTETQIYTLRFEAARLSAHRTKVVRGVTLKTETMALPEWLSALNHEVQKLADQAGVSHDVLHDFLMS